MRANDLETDDTRAACESNFISPLKKRLTPAKDSKSAYSLTGTPQNSTLIRLSDS